MTNRLSAVVVVLLSTVTAAAAQDPTPPQPTTPTPGAKALHAAGPEAPLTIYPVRVLGRPDANVADALGLVLERSGMSDLAVAETPFDPGDTEWDAVPAKLKLHVLAHRVDGAAGRHGLYAQFLGDPKQGPTEVRFVVVDGGGGLVLSDRQTPADRAFQRTAGRDPDPLGCATLVGERLFALAEWKKVPGGVRDGAFQRRWQQKSGAPDARERTAMAERVKALRAHRAEASFAVLPTLWGGEADVASAARLADGARTALGCKAATLVAGELAVRPSSNEQRRLWDLVASLRAALKKQPIDADYALVADIGLRQGGGAGFVHVVVMSKAGEVVLADWQNDQHPLFQQLAPKNLQDGEAVAVARLQQLLR